MELHFPIKLTYYMMSTKKEEQEIKDLIKLLSLMK
jgi:hypothetical protein